LSIRDIEERLKRIENMLASILDRIEKLEDYVKKYGYNTEGLDLAVELTSIFSLPLTLGLEAAKRVLKILSSLELDPISRDIVKVLSTCEKLTASEITRRVKQVRGKASRRIIIDRLKKLMNMGIIVDLGSSNRHQYVLKKCIEGE